MKWLTSITYLALGATSVSAAPAVVPTDNWPPTVYRLMITSSPYKPLVGKYLSIFNNTVGLNPARPGSPIQVYPRAGAGADKVSLHTYPVGIIDHCIGLVGPAGTLLTLTDLANPAAITYPAGTTADWTSFTMGTAPGPEAAPGRAGPGTQVLSYGKAGAGTWIAMPTGNKGDWTVQWDDGKSFRMEIYQTITMSYEAVPDSSADNPVRK